MPKVWKHFIISRHLLSTNLCEVTKERAILIYDILQDIKFDVGEIIKEVIWYNKDGRMNLGHPFLIFQLCKQADVQSSNQEDLLHPIKAIQVRTRKGILEPRCIVDSSNESTSEEEEEDKEKAIEPTI